MRIARRRLVVLLFAGALGGSVLGLAGAGEAVVNCEGP
jgi:hypothetical protein